MNEKAPVVLVSDGPGCHNLTQHLLIRPCEHSFVVASAEITEGSLEKVIYGTSHDEDQGSDKEASMTSLLLSLLRSRPSFAFHRNPSKKRKKI